MIVFKLKTALDMRIGDWSSDVCSSELKNLGRERAHREHQSAACAVRFFEQGRDDDDGGAGRASGSDAQLMLGGGHQQFPEPAPVRPELVDGPLFSFGRRTQVERSFDKIRTKFACT